MLTTRTPPAEVAHHRLSSSLYTSPNSVILPWGKSLVLHAGAVNANSRSTQGQSPLASSMGNPIFESQPEHDEQANRDHCRYDRTSRRRLDLARNPFRIPLAQSHSERRRAQVTRTSHRGDTFTLYGEQTRRQPDVTCMAVTSKLSLF